MTSLHNAIEYIIFTIEKNADYLNLNDLKPLFKNKGIDIDENFIKDLIRLREMYVYINKHHYSDMQPLITAIKNNLSNNLRPSFKNFPPIIKEFFNLYSNMVNRLSLSDRFKLLSSILGKMFDSSLVNLILKYDAESPFFYESILDKIGQYLIDISAIPYSNNYVNLLRQEEYKIKSFVERIPSPLFPSQQIKYKYIFDRWPHQTWFQAIMGELFYPQELREFNDSPIDLYGRPNIRLRLAFSASYENPIAYYDLSELMAIYFNNDDKRINSKAKTLKTVFKGKANQYFSRGLREGTPYIQAISSWNLHDENTRDLIYKAIIEQKEYRLLNYLSTGFPTGQLRKHYLDALNHGYPEALLALSIGTNSSAESILWSLQAAEVEHIAAGYYNVALKLHKQGIEEIRKDMGQVTDPMLLKFKENLNTNFVPEDIDRFLDKAGELGMSTALEEKAKMHDFGSPEWEEAYMKAATTLNDEHSWFMLGVTYSQRGQIQQAEDFLMRAGIRGYLWYIHRNPSQQWRDQASHNIYNHLVELGQIANRK